MVMSAGLGTRLRPFSEFHPKALIPVMGIPVIQFGIDQLSAGGIKRIVANVHHHPEKMLEGLEELDNGAAELIVNDETQMLLGSAGGIRHALPRFEGKPFFYLNADRLWEINLRALEARHLQLRAQSGVRLTLAVSPRGPAGGKYREIVLDPDRGLIRSIGEVVEGRPFFMGVAIIESDAFDHVPPEGPAEFVPTILEPAIRDGKAGFCMVEGPWLDVDSPSQWLETHLSLIGALETGALPQLWRRRIESRNLRIGERTWISRKAPHPRNASRWIGPCYWDGPADPPEELGPSAVIYGMPPVDRPFERGIGFAGIWFRSARQGP